MTRTLYLLLLLTAIGTACGKRQAAAETQQAATPDSTAVHIIDPAMPHLTSEEVNVLFNAAEKVDMIFYNHPISVTQEDTPSVRNTVRYIMPTPPNVTARCNPLGRLAWLAGGTIMREADVYMGNGCNYLLFMQNNQPVAANAMANEGVQFFTNILSQVNQKQQQIRQQTQQQQ
jgi:hypothetical protein